MRFKTRRGPEIQDKPTARYVAYLSKDSADETTRNYNRLNDQERVNTNIFTVSGARRPNDDWWCVVDEESYSTVDPEHPEWGEYCL